MTDSVHSHAQWKKEITVDPTFFGRDWDLNFFSRSHLPSESGRVCVTSPLAWPWNIGWPGSLRLELQSINWWWSCLCTDWLVASASFTWLLFLVTVALSLMAKTLFVFWFTNVDDWQWPALCVSSSLHSGEVDCGKNGTAVFVLLFLRTFSTFYWLSSFG